MNETELTYVQHIRQQNNFRVNQQEKLFDYYIGDHQTMIDYLNTALRITFDIEDIREFQKDYINITKKIINQLAIVYKDPANRNLMKGKEVSTKISDAYNDMLPPDINTIDKMAHRYAKLFNTSLTWISVRNDTLFYEVRPSHLYNIKVDDNDPYKMIEVSYDKYIKDANGKDELWTVVWTDENHYKKQVLSFGDKMSYGDEVPISDNNSGMINPYGIIPAVELRLEKQGSFWGTGLCDLVNTSEQINFLLTDLINGGINQTWGTLFLVNTGLAKSKSKVRIGPKHPIAVDGSESGDARPDAKMINGTPAIREAMDHIDWKIKLIAISKGINPNSFLQEVKATSGFSKIIDAFEQLEIRRDDIEPCRIYEDKRFEVTRAIINYHANLPGSTLTAIETENTYLETTFLDIEIPQAVDDQIKSDTFELENNIISIIDLMKKKNPDLTEKDIIKKLEKNAADNLLYLKPVAVADVNPPLNQPNPLNADPNKIKPMN